MPNFCDIASLLPNIASMTLPLNSWFEKSFAIDRHNAMSAYAIDVTAATTDRNAASPS